ncbi:hypothetical protein [Staphylococcus shinii]|uniref:hypothetical protein n=1 Tax=Staphylococcus shinii TaxID=2912228 RepID=UPI003D80363A
MKIKTKKQLNLPQLIEWGWKNTLLSYGKLYKKDDQEFGDYASFDHRTNEIRVCGKIDWDDTFTVEVEEEITEDTVFEYLINVYRGNGTFMELDTNECINEYNVANLIEVHAYIDGEFKLIWRDGKLVE